MKTILYVYHVSSVGGGSYCLLNVLKAVDRTKYRPVVLLRSDGPLVSEIKKLDIEVCFFPAMLLCRYNTSIWAILSIIHDCKLEVSKKKFGDILQKINPDILYLNSMMFNPYLPIAKKLGFKTIIHVREHWPENEHIWQRQRALNNISKYADQVVAINKYSASMCTNTKNPITIVYDWIDMDSRYQEMPLSKLMNENVENKKVFLFTGGLQVIKGTKEVLDNFCNSMTNPDYRLLLLGIDPNTKSSGLKGFIKRVLSIVGYKTYGERICDMIKTDKRIVCVPALYELTHILQQVYCVISYFKIPHANLALAECVICNTPMIAARTEESLEYSNNGELAELFEMNNEEEFIRCVNYMDSVYDDIKKKLSSGSILIKKLFDPNINSERLNQVYHKLD